MFLALCRFYLLFSKIPPSTIWFVVYDGMPCWNMIGQNEDRLLYKNTGQAFSIDIISQETSGPASLKSPLKISLLQSFSALFYWPPSCQKLCQSTCIPQMIGVADMDLLCDERTLKLYYRHGLKFSCSHFLLSSLCPQTTPSLRDQIRHEP